MVGWKQNSPLQLQPLLRPVSLRDVSINQSATFKSRQLISCSLCISLLCSQQESFVLIVVKCLYTQREIFFYVI